MWCSIFVGVGNIAGLQPPASKEFHPTTEGGLETRERASASV